ncbi:hypothetical protein POKO110462_11310 [Pontibacter korlensis]|uniref:CYTH domain-containing protein n=1 Tax=Pontibacter korlensis TaxID=400092 RepID=A0A0E3UYM2_9BACT|nr:hypothetical protein [Pontibacter korlensis]AKD04571.1 hypothetical protein PKOR_17570 [Pontibacter korlensis]
MYTSVSFKARLSDFAEAQTILLEQEVRFLDAAMQLETYYKVEQGKLKLIKGGLENALVHYQQQKHQNMFFNEVLLYLKRPSSGLVETLYGSPQPVVELKKLRKTFVYDNLKVHLDQLETLGYFVEVEALDIDGSYGLEHLLELCESRKELLQLEDEDLVQEDYPVLLNQITKSINPNNNYNK